MDRCKFIADTRYNYRGND